MVYFISIILTSMFDAIRDAGSIATTLSFLSVPIMGPHLLLAIFVLFAIYVFYRLRAT